MLTELLRRTHLSAPSDLAAVVADPVRRIGAQDVVLYLIDYEQRTLVPLPGSHPEHLAPLSVTGTIAGRAFSTTSILRSSSEEGSGQRLWLPLLDGTERLGVISMSFEAAAVSERTVMACERYAHLIAMLIVSKSAYGDVFEVTRRRRQMTIASELLWQLAPPLVFATDRIVVAGMLEPCYDNGGFRLEHQELVTRCRGAGDLRSGASGARPLRSLSVAAAPLAHPDYNWPRCASPASSPTA